MSGVEVQLTDHDESLDGVKQVIDRHRDIEEGVSVVRFISDIDDIPVNDSQLTEGSKSLSETGSNEFVIGLEHPSGKFSLYRFSRPTPGDWEGSEVKEFLDSIGVAPANLEDAVGERVDVTFANGEVVPRVLYSENTQNDMKEINLAMGFVLLVNACAVLLAPILPVIGLFILWIVFFGYLRYNLNIVNQ